MWQGTEKVRKFYSFCFIQHVTQNVLNEKFVRCCKSEINGLKTSLIMYKKSKENKIKYTENTVLFF